MEASGPAADSEIHVDFEEAEFLAAFPLKGKGRMRLVGPIRWDPDLEHRELTFDDVSERAIKNLKLTIVKVNWFSTYRVHHRVAAKFREGRAFLLGDAAHVHSPVGGQGMNTGIGDAVNLAWKFAAVLNEGAADSLLDTYERERIGFARRLVATTDRAFTLITTRGAVARWIRTRLFPVNGPAVVPTGRGAPLPIPHRITNQCQLPQQSPQRGFGRRRSRRRPPALDSNRAGKRQLRSARFAEVAGSCLRRTASGRGRCLRRTTASPASVRVASGNAQRRPPAQRRFIS